MIAVWMFAINGILWISAKIFLFFGFSQKQIEIIANHGDIPTLFWGLLAFGLSSHLVFEPKDKQWWQLSSLLVGIGIFFIYWFFSFSSS